MTPEQIQTESSRISNNGYLEWLVSELEKRAIQKFRASDSSDSEGLRHARITFGIAEELIGIVTDGSGRHINQRRR